MRWLLAGLAAVAAGPGVAGAQVQEPPSTGGLVALDQALRFLGQTKRVLLIAAHPDDEDTELLTILARGMGAETAYLALTRGEGGQNLIGPELGDGLGIVRSEELLAARRLDGARQYFTRAFDFGYSKGLDDTWAHWPRDSVVKDVVRVIRRFRPQIVIAMFSGTARDGHGQHQASGWAAREGFEAAGDPARFPELEAEEGLHPWAPAKLYRDTRFGGDGAVRLDGGVLDPAVGQSFLQIAMRSRSLHRSQDMGAAQRLGPSEVRLDLVADRTGAGPQEGGLWAGVDTTLAAAAPASATAAARVRLREIGARLRGLRPWTVGAARGLRRELGALLGEGTAGARAEAADQLRRVDEALFIAAAVLCDALSSRERLVPGEGATMVLSCWNPSRDTVVLRGALRVLGRVVGSFGPQALPPGGLVAESVTVAVPRDAHPTNPYFLDLPKQPGAALYQWRRSLGAVAATPFEPPPAAAEFVLGDRGRMTREVVYRYVDQVIGEVRRPLAVVPALTVAISPGTVLWPVADGGPRRLLVTVRAEGTDSVAGDVRLEGPAEWDLGGARRFGLAPPRRAEQTFAFLVRPPEGAREGRHVLRAVIRDDQGREYRQGSLPIEHPHIRPRRYLRAAETEIVLARISLPGPGRIAYVRGAADRVPEALAALGLDVTVLDADSLARGDLSGFRALVVGPRAYETDPVLVEHSARLLDFARAGGTVVVQYQQQAYFRGDYGPAALSYAPADGPSSGGRIAAPRVAEEAAAVTVLVPEHPVFHRPNRIGPADWAGWVQERGLYFALEWAPPWRPLLAMADRDEPPREGGLLIAPVGRGWYVYTGLSFFRQLPAAVPGAARLFLNLLGLGGGAGTD